MARRLMLKTKMKRITARSNHAVERLAEIESSIAALADNDLLDLADIFKAEFRTPIGEIALRETMRRNISV